MSDLETKTFSVGDNIYALRYSSYGCYVIEETLGIACTTLMNNMQSGKAMFREITAMLLGGLEGARKAHKNRPRPWTIEEVCDIIDEAGIRTIANICLEHFMKSFIATNPEAAKAAEDLIKANEKLEEEGKENPTKLKKKAPTKDG